MVPVLGRICPNSQNWFVTNYLNKKLFVFRLHGIVALWLPTVKTSGLFSYTAQIYENLLIELLVSMRIQVF